MDQEVSVTIRARQLTEQAFQALSKAMKALEDDAEQAGKRTTQALSSALTDVEKRFKTAGSSLTGVGTSLTAAITLPIVGVAGASVKAAIDFETAFSGVRKTVSGTKPELDAIAASFRQMSKDVPVSAVELAHVGEMAGQLGVQKEKIVGFTKTIADIATATNLTADQAGASFARIANITKMPQEQFANLGSAVVALGNYGASTEQEMLDMALRISGAGATVGMQVPSIMGLANALSSVGLEAEAGGTAMSKVMIEMASAVSGGGDQLKRFAAIAGMSVDQFKTKFKTDAGGAIVSFVEGLGKIKDSGGNLLGTIEALGMTEVRLRDALLRSANAAGIVAESVRLGNKAFSDNSELTRAAGERYKTTENQLKLLWNALKDVGIELGSALLPLLQTTVQLARPLVDVVGKIASGFAALPGPLKVGIVLIGGIVAAIGPLLVIGGMLASAFASVVGALALFAPAGVSVAAGASAMTVAGAGLSAMFSTVAGVAATVGGTIAAFVTSPITLCVAAVGGLVLAIRYLTGSWDFITVPAKKVWDVLKDLWTILKNVSIIIGVELWGAFKKVGEFVTPIATAIGGALVGAFKSAYEWLAEKLGPALSWVADKLGAVFGFIKTVATGTTIAANAALGRTGTETAALKPVASHAPTAPPPAAPAPGPGTGGFPAGMPAALNDEQKEAIKARAKALEELAHVNDALTWSQRAVIESNKEMGLTDRQSALILGLHESTVKHYVDTLEDRRKVEEKLHDELVKIGAEAKKKFFEDQRKVMDATTSQMATNVLTRIEFEKKLSAATMTESERRVAAIEDEHRKAITALGVRMDLTAQQYDEAKAAIDAFYQHELDVDAKTGDTLIERLRAKGVKTRAELQQEAADARVQYEQMRDAVDGNGQAVYNATQIQDAYNASLAAADVAAGKTRNLLDTLADGFRNLAQSVGGALGSVIGGVGGILSNLQMARDAQKAAGGGSWGIASGIFAKGASTTDRIASGVASAGAIVSGAQNVWAATSSQKSALGNAGAGALAGAQAGAMFGPWGMAVGAAAGFVAGLIKGKPAWAKVQDEVAHDFGVSISKETADGIAKAAKQYGINKGQAATLSMTQLIAEGGGLNDKNISKFTGRAVELFDMAKRGGELGAKSIGELDKVMVQFGQHAVDSGTLGDRTFIAMLKRANVEGTQLAETGKYLKDRWTSALGGITTYLTTFATARGSVKDLDEQLAQTAEGSAEWTDLKKKRDAAAGLANAGSIKSDVAAGAFTAALSGTFSQLVKSGASPTEVIGQMEPAIAALKAQLEAAGIGGGVAFDSLTAKLALMKDEIAGPAIAATNALGGSMLEIYNAGGMTNEMFAGFTAQIGQTYAALKEQGKGGAESLALMQPTLQTLWSMQQEFNLALDDATQAMLDEAEASGIVGEKHKTDSQKMVDGIGKVVDRMDLLLRKMGVDLPDAASRGVGGVVDALGRIPRDIDVNVNYTERGVVGVPPQYEGEPNESHAVGALITRTHVATVHANELIGPVSFMTDALTGALQRVGLPSGPASSGSARADTATAAAIAKLADAIGSGSRGPLIGSLSVAPDRDTQQYVDNDLLPAIINSLRGNRGGARTRFRAELGLD